MNFLDILGKSIDDLPISAEEYTIAYSNIGIDEGMEPSWIIEAKNGTYEIQAHVNKIIYAVFLYPKEDLFPFLEFSTATTRQQVREKMGKPTHSANEKNIKALNFQGSFDSYSTDKFVVHFQYTAEESRLEIITMFSSDVFTKK